MITTIAWSLGFLALAALLVSLYSVIFDWATAGEGGALRLGFGAVGALLVMAAVFLCFALSVGVWVTR